MPNAHREDPLVLARRLFAEQLSVQGGPWTVSGDRVIGPGTVAVLIEKRHAASEAHLDFGTILDRDKPDAPVLWTCMTGFGDGLEATLKNTIEAWVVSTLPVVQEVFSQDGSNADQYGPGTPGGCPGWHVIHGPFSGMDAGTGGGDEITQWAVKHPLLPELGPLITPSFSRPDLNMVKVIIARGEEDIAEVRVNGERHEAASQKLASMDWPRGDWALVRCSILFMHPEGPAADPGPPTTVSAAQPPAPPAGPGPSPAVIFGTMAAVVALIAAVAVIRSLMGAR